VSGVIGVLDNIGKFRSLRPDDDIKAGKNSGTKIKQSLNRLHARAVTDKRQLGSLPPHTRHGHPYQ